MNEIIGAKTGTESETHGTVVSGIAAGCGAGTDFYGIAPDAELILVSTTLTDAAIADGLKYISEYANSVNKPCIINFSIGSSIGPHDGTSAFDRYCDSLSRPGLIFTGAVGNNGDKNLYFSHDFNFENNDTVILRFIVPDSGSTTTIVD